eukprot:373454-Pyramimonas_sp.AAC.1
MSHRGVTLCHCVAPQLSKRFPGGQKVSRIFLVMDSLVCYACLTAAFHLCRSAAVEALPWRAEGVGNIPGDVLRGPPGVAGGHHVPVPALLHVALQAGKPPLDPLWTPSGPPLDRLWTASGPPLDPLWTPSGPPLDPL